MSIKNLLEQIFSESLDLDEALACFQMIRETATLEDLPLLLKAIKSPNADFWIREMLADPISTVGGVAVLEDLLQAFELNIKEGHDVDSFCTCLAELAETAPKETIETLQAVKNVTQDTVDWLLEYCD